VMAKTNVQNHIIFNRCNQTESLEINTNEKHKAHEQHYKLLFPEISTILMVICYVRLKDVYTEIE
jgi:hypothetical protein